MGKGEADVVEARGDPGIILPLSCWWWWGGWEGIKTRKWTVQLVPKVLHDARKEGRCRQRRCARGSGRGTKKKDDGRGERR